LKKTVVNLELLALSFEVLGVSEAELKNCFCDKLGKVRGVLRAVCW